MKIIDRNKDYYDYLQGVYGIDNHVIFDRQNSVLLENDCWDKVFNRKCEPKENAFNSYYHPLNEYYSREFHFNEEFFILECGFTQYLFHLEIMKNNKWELSLKYIFQDNKHYKKQPLTLYFVELNIWNEYNFEKMNYANDVQIEQIWNTNKKGDKFIPKYTDIELPILKNLGIPSLIPAEDIWRDLYNYLLYQKDPQIADNRTDRQKLEAKGFDNITSFRHPIK